jgi:hypothetical protein
VSGDKVDWAERCESLRQAQADPRLTGMERRVFTVLWTFAGPDGAGARPGVELLAHCLSTSTHRVHVRTVRSVLKRLAELSYTEVTAPPVRRARIATTYRVRTPDISPETEFLAREALRGKPESFSAQSESFSAQSDGFSARTLRAQKVVRSEDRRISARASDDARAAVPEPVPDDPGRLKPPCPWCRDTNIVLNGDGIPGRRLLRLCHHDSSWHAMTDDEITEHADLIERLNKGVA